MRKDSLDIGFKTLSIRDTGGCRVPYLHPLQGDDQATPNVPEAGLQK